MAEFNISSIVQYYSSGTNTVSGTSTGTGSTAALARSAASTNAASAASGAGIGGGNPATGGSSSTTAMAVGSTIGAKTTSTGSATPATQQIDQSGNAYWSSTCTWSASRTSTMRQLKLKFTLPSGVTTSNLASATLTFTAANNGTNVYTYYVCAPKGTTEQTQFERWGDATTIDKTTYQSFSSPSNANSKTYSIDIKDIFKKCITNNQGWITLLIPVNQVEGDRYLTLSGTPSISYTLSYSACTAPTSISFTSIVKPGGTLTISWSGAGSGTNNAITGYDVYYKIGSAPTTSSYDGYENVSSAQTSGSKNFTISSSATRGSAFYAIIRAKGAAGSSYYSGWKSGNGGVVNSLPAAPTVSANRTRIPSGGGTVTFTVTAGTDANTSQTRTTYWATSTSGTKTKINNGTYTTGTLTSNTTYYFWTYDDLEYSPYASVSIVKNTPPTINSITMSAVASYSPSKRDGYVKNINGSASGVTGTSLTYQWKLLVGSGVDTTSFGTSTNISNTTSLSNIDVTSYGATFNTAYKLRLRVTDDLGEWVEKDTTTVFAIPAAPSISSIKNQKAASNASNTAAAHFDSGMRFYYSENNTGLTRELQYSTTSNFSSFSTISLGGTEYSDATLTSLTRGTTYYFRIKYTCNTKTTTTSVTTGYMRANDITPNISTISTIKPYTTNAVNITFTNQPTSWASGQDVSTNYNDIYTTTLEYGGRAQVISPTGTPTNSSGTVNVSLNFPNITTAQWKTLMGTTNAPNSSYTITLKVVAKNGFGTNFTGTKTFTVNFVEGISNIGTPTLRIKMTDGSFEGIPSSYNNKDTTSRYHIFEGQTLQVGLSGLQCYANQNATISLMLGTTVLGTVDVADSDWNGPDGRIYTLKTEKKINYSVPKNTIATYSSNIRNFKVRVVLANSNSSETDGGNLKSCFHFRFDSASINFDFTNVTETQMNWSCSDFGALEPTTKYSTGYSSVKIQPKYSIRPGDGYANLGAQETLTSTQMSSGGGIFSRSLSSITNDIIYFGAVMTVTLDFQQINSKTPYGTSTYSFTYNNLFTLYRVTPNLLYGKNFFVMNANSPKMSGTSEVANQLLVIRPTVNRKVIYIGTDGEEGTFEITANGLEIDCGTW